jgi:signal transduction histidine kinase
LLTPDDKPAAEAAFSSSLDISTRPIILHWQHKNGTPRCAELYSWQVTDERGNPLTLEGIVRDITERTQAETELRASAQQLQHLSRRLLEAHERERRNIACELHDEVGQVLTGLKLTLAVAAAGAPASLAATLDSAQTTINDLTGKVRALSLDLRPALLDDKGLIPALTWYLERYTSRTGVQIELCHEGVSCRFSSEIETVAYRIIQESLTNVARYAGIHEATVRLLANTTHLMLCVDDSGRGFDVSSSVAAQTTGGLSGMYERVQLIGGILTIDSMIGVGTRVIAELPLPCVEHEI